MTNTSTDCLILKIQEYIDDKLDTTLYILYDKNQEYYIVNGKRSNIIGKNSHLAYSFSCKYGSELIDFINFFSFKSRITVGK